MPYPVFMKLFKTMKITDLSLAFLAFYFIIFIILFAGSSLLNVPPFYVDDFVVDSRGNIIVASSFQCRLFFLAPNGQAITSIKIPESKGSLLLAVDNSDNVYFNRLYSVSVYALNRQPKIYSSDWHKTNDWLLDNQRNVANLNRPRTYKTDGCTQGNRKITKPGELLFFDSQCSSGSNEGIFVDFISSDKVYRCNTILRNKLGVYDCQGHFLYSVTLIPWYLVPFSLPLPAPFILAAMGGVTWILMSKTKISQSSSRPR